MELLRDLLPTSFVEVTIGVKFFFEFGQLMIGEVGSIGGGGVGGDGADDGGSGGRVGAGGGDGGDGGRRVHRFESRGGGGGRRVSALFGDCNRPIGCCESCNQRSASVNVFSTLSVDSRRES